MSENIIKIDGGTEKPTVVSIKTFGCQMNMYDTEVAGGLLQQDGYKIVDEDAGVTKVKSASAIGKDIDVYLMNTCSVREHAEERVYGRLGMLGKAKKNNPDLIVGLMGCMVEEHRESLFKRYPQIDLLVGTRNIADLPALIADVRQNRKQVSKIKHDGISIEYTEQIKRVSDSHAWLPIMTGCNKVCTFCIVPITRGSEVSMPAREVYREASRLVDEGVQWITLLGQNVNSYDGQEKGLNVDFPKLLDMLCGIEGLKRISFTTSHPQDATPELYEVIAKNPKISRRFHLPLQSGSDAMLKRMKRLHNYQTFKEKIERMREMIPDVVITTDIIAGFSGESEEDHEATKKALRELRFDGAFIYKYSVRPDTPAAKLEDSVPLEEKERRNQELLDIQRDISTEQNKLWIGKTVEVFVEGTSSKNKDELVGRSLQEKKVVFPGHVDLKGQFVNVKITDLKHETFIGQKVN